MAETARVNLGRPWAPVVLAAVIGAAMLLLAAEPFKTSSEPERFEVEVPPIELETPAGSVAAFPDRFAWSAVESTAYYLIGVARVDGDQVDPLFRQQGKTNELQLQFDPGTVPPSGRYAWEVLAFGPDGFPRAKGAGEFVVE